MSTLDEKLSQLQQLEAEITALRNKEKAEGIAQAKALINKYGLKAKELGLGGDSSPEPLAKKRGGGPSNFQYVNPADEGQIYKGRGPKPAWFAALSADEQAASKRAL
jgi:DNA-binding protein H-NS